jgi:hypothetical protein
VAIESFEKGRDQCIDPGRRVTLFLSRVAMVIGRLVQKCVFILLHCTLLR